MKCVRLILCFAALSLSCTGCWPLRVTSSPGASGVVVDAQTGTPIAGAQAEMYRKLIRSTLQATNARPPIVITGSDGKFVIPRERKWILYVPIGVLAPSSGVLVISHDGYQSEIIPMEAPLNRKSKEAEQKYEYLGSVKMKRESQ